jgi:RNA polymerase sigma-70 factor (sigma-E family)
VDAVPGYSVRDHGIAPAGALVRRPRPRCYVDDEVLAALYRQHYAALVRQAALVLGDVGAAEDAVQDSFVAIYGQRLRDGDKAVYYLRRTVINRARSMLRHKAVADRHQPAAVAQAPSAEEQAVARWECALVAAALKMLPPRQREALVLRYYADLPEAQIAAAMGVSAGSVKTHQWRAIASLRALLAAELREPRPGQRRSGFRQR